MLGREAVRSEKALESVIVEINFGTLRVDRRAVVEELLIRYGRRVFRGPFPVLDGNEARYCLSQTTCRSIRINLERPIV
jgi:hypothetical protein